MHELRKDPLLSRWVAVLDSSIGPQDYERLPENEDSGICPLCAGREDETPPEILAIRPDNSMANTGGWSVRVIPRLKPILQIEGDLGRKGVGMYDKMNSVGANELIIESPIHNKRPEDIGAEHVKRLLMVYKMRIADLEKDARIRYVSICKNSGKSAGAVYLHPHSEIIATPVIPKLLKEELDSAKHYYSYKERCIFCDIMAEEMRTGKRVIDESKNFIAFCPYAPKFPFEFWLMPKKHNCAFQDISIDELNDLSLIMTSLLKKIRSLLKEPSFHYVLHTAPNRIPRRDHWHTLGDDFHWHMEFTPRLTVASGFEWGSDFYVLATSPEDAAKYIKEA